MTKLRIVALTFFRRFSYVHFHRYIGPPKARRDRTRRGVNVALYYSEYFRVIAQTLEAANIVLMCLSCFSFVFGPNDALNLI